ncbi:MAG: DUF58 domain-containing protein [Chloroflexota bacterium]
MRLRDTFGEALLGKLSRLRLVVRRARPGRQSGERRSPKKGRAIEFADFRRYAVGDDPRLIDWNVYARLEKLFVRLYQEEEDVTAHILIDASRSMDWGEPNKLQFALRLGAALGYIVLATSDRLLVSAVRDDQVIPLTPPLRGKHYTLELLRQLEAVAAGGTTRLNAALTAYAGQPQAAGPLVLISDLFAPEGFEAGLRALQGAGYEVTVCHVLAPQELEPDLMGDLELVDVETGDRREVSLTPADLNEYAENLSRWREGVAAWCLRRGINFIPLDTRIPFEELIFKELPRRGVLV